MSLAAIIHPSAVLEGDIQLAPGVIIGPFCHLKGQISLGADTCLEAQVVISGKVRLGARNRVSPFAVIGSPPQDLSYKNEPTEVVIGDDNWIREYVSINRGTMKEQGSTQVGSRCLLMSYVHLGHDVVLGDEVRIVNSCNLAGHVKVGPKAIISGACSVSQFVTIGRNAFIGGGSAVDKDIPPFMAALGNRVQLKGVNIVGLKRLGIEKQHISEAVDFYRTMEISPLSAKNFCSQVEIQEEYQKNPVVQEMMAFILQSTVGLPAFTP